MKNIKLSWIFGIYFLCQGVIFLLALLACVLIYFMFPHNFFAGNLQFFRTCCFCFHRAYALVCNYC